ncbi:hypothetical protein I4U23_013927 [Adineta vaga]|nr:hypothetical protein I4U23_013927 [Adineta vaga]
MYFQSILLAILLVFFTTNLYALNTTRVPIVNCTRQSQCTKTQFCNTKQRVCLLKYSLNTTCQSDNECVSDKCHDKMCRQSCRSDSNCSTTKEYCTISRYCAMKHCGACARNAQCANNHCSFFRCVESNCTATLTKLKKL